MDGSEKLRAAEVLQQFERARSHEARLRRARAVLVADITAVLDIRPPEFGRFLADPG